MGDETEMGSRNAKARLLHWKISYDQRVNTLGNPWIMLLYTWLIPCQDNLGRLEGDADVIKGMVFPRLKRVKESDVEQWLQALHDHGLIFRYHANGGLYLQFPVESVGRHQRVVGNMSKESDFPNLPTEEYEAWLKQARGRIDAYERVRTRSPELNRSEQKETEQNGRLDDGFTRFWEQYPRKVGKGAAERVWDRLKPSLELEQTMLAAIARTKASPQWLKDAGQFIPHPKTWLQERRWEDEVSIDLGQKPEHVRRLEAEVLGHAI